MNPVPMRARPQGSSSFTEVGPLPPFLFTVTRYSGSVTMASTLLSGIVRVHAQLQRLLVLADVDHHGIESSDLCLLGLVGGLVVVTHQLVKEVLAQRLYARRRDAELATADGNRLAVGDGGHGIAGTTARSLDHTAVGKAVVVEGRYVQHAMKRPAPHQVGNRTAVHRVPGQPHAGQVVAVQVVWFVVQVREGAALAQDGAGVTSTVM